MLQGNGGKLLGSLWPIVVTSGTVLALRIFAKVSRGRLIWWDDIIMIFSWTVLFVATCLITRAAALGFGVFWDQLAADVRFEIQTYSVVYSASLTVVVASARVSFAVALLRLTQGSGRAWRAAIAVIITGLVCITTLPVVVSRFAICTPFQKVYGHVEGGHCGNTYIPLYLGYASAGWSALCDFALTFMAWRLIWSMRMAVPEKIGVGVALSFGLFSGFITIMRYTYVSMVYTADFFEYGYVGFIWMAAEGATSIIAASLPALRAFVVDKTTKPDQRPNWLMPSLYGGGPLNRPRSSTTRKSPSASSWRGSPSRPGSAAAGAASSVPDATGADRSLYPTDYDLIYSTEWDYELPGNQPPDAAAGEGELPARTGSRAELTEAHLARHSMV